MTRIMSALFGAGKRKKRMETVDDELLPPRPGEAKRPESRNDCAEVPITIYVNGRQLTMSRAEALGAMAQITQILLYLEGGAKPEEPRCR
jgi:hypothetical protein